MITYVLLVDGRIELTTRFNDEQKKYLELYYFLFEKYLNDKSVNKINIFAIDESNTINDITDYFIDWSLKYDPLKKAVRLNKRC